MSLQFNIRHVEKENLHLEGDLAVEDLALDLSDELVHPGSVLSYDLDIQQLENGILAQGTLKLPLNCECARCLKPISCDLAMESWACHLALEGEDEVEIVNDCVDLTPYIREDILLSIPQHPLCEPECKGLVSPKKDLESGGEPKTEVTSTAWAALNKLKF
ncbi:MAG TPA: YceD family protein [Verrucomicrobiae bacterium]|jgi:uncharacterized protein